MGLFLIAAFSIDASRYSALIDPLIIQNARKAGVLVTLQNTGLGILPPKYKADSITILPRGWFSGLVLSRLTLIPHWGTLLGGRIGARVSALAYNGELSGDVTIVESENGLDTDFDLNGLQLNQHPVIEGFGIHSGLLDIKGSQFSVRNREPRGGSISLELKGLGKPEASQLSLQTFGLPLNINIPSFSALDLKANCSAQQPAKLNCLIESSSSLLELSGQIDAGFVGGQLNELGANLKVHLADQGSAALGQYLPLLSTGVLKADSRAFSINISGPIRSPRIKFSV
ncbi:MAG: hypothetical protein K1X79_12050 [Oligoflexia bacterium]|nr:hypothetical protein [Oligoflexia bacterium]